MPWAQVFRLSMSDSILSRAGDVSYTAFKDAATRLFWVKGSEVRAIRDLLGRSQRLMSSAPICPNSAFWPN